jgi:P-type conjugative transfer protein TrbJ
MKRFFSVGILFMHHQLSAFVVNDPINLVENALSAAAEVEQLFQAMDRVEYQIRSTQRFIDKLEGYKFTDIRGFLRDLRSFRNRARSIGYGYKNIVNQFERTYGKDGRLNRKFSAWKKQSDDSIKDAMISQGLLEKSEGHMADLDKVNQAKSKSEGEAETLHAISEVNTIQSKQLADLTQIVATDARARQSVVMEERLKQQDQKDYENRLMHDFNDHKKSRPLAYFPSLGSTAPQVQR